VSVVLVPVVVLPLDEEPVDEEVEFEVEPGVPLAVVVVELSWSSWVVPEVLVEELDEVVEE
jgi:hypothetical protein